MSQALPIYKPELVPGVVGYEIHEYLWKPSYANRGICFEFVRVVKRVDTWEEWLDFVKATEQKEQ